MAPVTGVRRFRPIHTIPGELGQIRANLMDLDKELPELDWGKSEPISGNSGANKGSTSFQIGAGEFLANFAPPPHHITPWGGLDAF